jgi:hypothetical protein
MVYRCFSLVVLVLFAVAAMPHALTVDFRAGAPGTEPDCVDPTSLKYCPSVGVNDCKQEYKICTGGAKKNALNCQEGKGDQACKTSSLCEIMYNAKRDAGNCKEN